MRQASARPKHIASEVCAVGVATAVVLALITPTPSFATDVNAITTSRTSQLGGAYQSEKQAFVGQGCITGTSINTGTPVSTFTFDQALSQTDAQEQLGMEAGGRARFGAVETSAAARFMRSATSSQYSASAVWLSDYKLPTQKLSAPALNDIGQAVRNHDERWAQTCGDEYVDEISRGAKLFFSIRVDFLSSEQKREFEASFRLSGPMYGASATLREASTKFSRSTKIQFVGLQVGGDPSKLTGLFPDTPEGRSGFVDCTLGDFEKCAGVITAALTYATDVDEGFPSQIAPGAEPGGAILEYKTAPYVALAIYPKNYPYLDQANTQARSELHARFERHFHLQVVAARLLIMGIGSDQYEAVRLQKIVIDRNIGLLLEASRTCYEDPLNCYGGVSGLKLDSVDEAVLALPPIHSFSFRLMTPNQGVWGRSESVDYLASDLSLRPEDQSNYEQCLVLHADDKDVCDVYWLFGADFRPRHTLEDVEDGSSIVLLIEGVALTDASLFFENRVIKTVSLVRGADAFPEKVGENQALIVLETTRMNPGWRDVDLAAVREALWASEMPQASGVFYLVVRDGFDRTIRVDLEWQRWSRREVKSGAVYVEVFEEWTERNRWWNAEDNNLLGDGNWSRVIMDQRHSGRIVED